MVKSLKHIDYPVLDPVLALKKFSNFSSWLAQVDYEIDLGYLLDREGFIRYYILTERNRVLDLRSRHDRMAF